MSHSERPPSERYGVGAAGPHPADESMRDTAYRAPAARRRLPTLDDLRVASPCSVPWDSMTGNGRVRSCAQCSKQVFNISNMSRADAEVLLREHVEGVCVRFYRRLDGTILTTDCPVGIRSRLSHMVLTSAVVTVAAGILALVGIKLFGGSTCRTATMGALVGAEDTTKFSK
jgi:hypothetical protein